MSNVQQQSKSMNWNLLILISFVFIVLIWMGIRVALPDSPSLFAGARRSNLGVKAGQLAPCPSSPNCVNSQSQDNTHYIEPIAYQGSPYDAIATLKRIVETQPRTKIIAQQENYLYAEFASRWMGFVDDVEFYVNEDKGFVEVRSASRLGESDLGVNRQRIENIRSEFN